MSLEGKSVQEIQALAELADGLASDPKTRTGFLRLTKAINPNTPIPEIDIPASMQSLLEGPMKQLDALSKKQEERDLKDRIEEQRRQLRAKGVTDAEIPKIEKLMVDKHIASHDTAIEHLRMSERSAEPTPATTSNGMRRFEQPKPPDLKAFNGDGKAYSYAKAYETIDELRGRKPASA